MTENKTVSLRVTDSDGEFRRKDSEFRSFVSRAPEADFPPEKDRYVLYVTLGCPWAHRTNIVRSLKGLEDIIPLVLVSSELGERGWVFNGTDGSAEKDPLYGFKYMQELYFKANPAYTGRYTVPVLWDKKKETIVSNESSEIIRMFYSEFDDLLPEELRESNQVGGGYYPEHLREEINEMNTWVYDTINNGVYKTGFATTQEAYDTHVYPLFESLDRIEKHLGQPGHQPYLFGEQITDTDIRLFTTILRFDTAYVPIFKCNIKMIRYDYPRIHKWLRLLYWDESEKTRGGAFKKTSTPELYKRGYLNALRKNQGVTGNAILPAGPIPAILPLETA